MSSCEVCGGPLPIPSRRRAKTICRRCGSTYEFAPVSEEELYQRAVVQANPQLYKSETMSLTIKTALAATNGKIGAIRVQDIAKGLWFSWDVSTRTWDKTPTVTPGNTLYIAVWAINLGEAGNVRIRLTDDTGKVLADKTVWCPYWGGDITIGVGVETGTIAMPDRDYVVTINVTP